MSNISYGWFSINDHGNTSKDGQLTIGSVQANTGWDGRSKTITIRTSGNATATLTVAQSAAEKFITIDHVETNYGGQEVLSLPAAGGDYVLVGYANVVNISASENDEKDYTDINDLQGRLWEFGYTVIVGGVTHSGLTPEEDYDYGRTMQYEWRIPFYVYANETVDAIEINITVEDDDSRSDSIVLKQLGSENDQNV